MNDAAAPPRQTVSYLRALLESRGLRPRSKLGQSFLIDLNLLDLLVRTADPGPGDLVLEVGAGTGSLTARLAERAGAVLAVEIDSGFCQLAASIVQNHPNVTLLNADVLAGKNRLNPEVTRRLAEMSHRPGIERVKLAANLPYVVATPVITNLLLGTIPFERMAATIQWELAERLTAAPSTKEYSAVSVIVQSLCDVTLVRRLPPTAFWPRPKVDSAILLIRPDAEKRRRIRDLPGFHSFVRDLYLHRRKNLRGALLPIVRQRFDKETLDKKLTAAGFDPSGRAEALTVDEHLRLYETLA